MTGGTLAAWAVETGSVHAINTGSLRGEIVEEYTEPDALLPGMVVSKIAHVENTGGLPLLARVRIDLAWGAARGSDGKVIADPTLPTNNILPDLNTTYWLDGGDGWYYYKGVIEPGQKSAQPLLSRFEVSKETGNAYQGKLADIVLTVECLQADGNAAEAVWNRSFAELNIVVTTPPGATTRVTFVDTEHDFAFDPATTDLFANFKNLLPGDTRTQTITVRNAYSQPVTIFLKADFIEQSLATPGNLALVRAMLEEYAQIIVTDANGRLIYEGAVWGNYPNDPAPGQMDSMKYYIPLGMFPPGASRDLTVALTLSPELDNRYQNLWGLVKWWWLAQGPDADPMPTPTPTCPGVTIAPTCQPTPTPTCRPTSFCPPPGPGKGPGPGYSPKTADPTLRTLWLALLASAGVTGALLCAPQRKRSWR